MRANVDAARAALEEMKAAVAAGIAAADFDRAAAAAAVALARRYGLEEAALMATAFADAFQDKKMAARFQFGQETSERIAAAIRALAAKGPGIRWQCNFCGDWFSELAEANHDCGRSDRTPHEAPLHKLAAKEPGNE
jgi:hypothetical protein